MCDFVALCAWISRDRRDADPLRDLLERRLAASPVPAALERLAISGLPWAPAVGAILALMRLAHDALTGAVGSSIGLYRTSFLAHERFGVGRHPADGLRRAQDVSFALRIEDVAADR